MTSDPDATEGIPERSVGPWKLGEVLGTGGNADVYAATRGGSEGRVALKVLRSRRPAAEPYQRFRREVETLRRLGPIPGVLPLLDAHLPEAPTSEDRAWLAMPIATPIDRLLSGRPLVEIVEAIATVAKTLAGLATRGIWHRDIKPGNLYGGDGDWLVGDFGLVAVPDVEAITRGDRPIGPRHFTPSEVLVGDREVDWSRVDVYALAKTLWILAADQRHPPDGHQPAATPGLRLSDYAQHEHASVLDRLIDVATSIDPAVRPSMERFADDLRAWIELPESPEAIDIQASAQRIRERLARELDSTNQKERWRDDFRTAIRQLQTLMRPLNEALKEILGRAEIDRSDDREAAMYLSSPELGGLPEIIDRHIRTSRISSGPDYSPFTLSVSRCLELTEEGILVARFMIMVSHAHMGGTQYQWTSGGASEPVGSVASTKMIAVGVDEMRARLVDGLNAFEEGLPENE